MENSSGGNQQNNVVYFGPKRWLDTIKSHFMLMRPSPSNVHSTFWLLKSTGCMPPFMLEPGLITGSHRVDNSMVVALEIQRKFSRHATDTIYYLVNETMQIVLKFVSRSNYILACRDATLRRR